MNHETCTKARQDETHCIYCPSLRECKKEKSREVLEWLKHRLPS
jgi:hypothetical protein